MSIEYKTGILSGVGTVGGDRGCRFYNECSRNNWDISNNRRNSWRGGWALVLEWSLQSL